MYSGGGGDGGGSQVVDSRNAGHPSLTIRETLPAPHQKRPAAWRLRTSHVIVSSTWKRRRRVAVAARLTRLRLNDNRDRMNVRRTQSVRNHQKVASMYGADDLGVLKEGEDSVEGALRTQLLEKDRENDKVNPP